MLGFVGRLYRTYKIEFGLTMLNAVEVTIFNTFLALIVGVSTYYLYNVGTTVAGMLKA